MGSKESYDYHKMEFGNQTLRGMVKGDEHIELEKDRLFFTGTENRTRTNSLNARRNFLIERAVKQ